MDQTSESHPLSFSPSNHSSFPSINDLSQTRYSSSSLSLSHFRLAHINVRSLVPHFAQIRDLIEFLKLNVLGLSETWLSERDDSIYLNIQNYIFLRSDRVSGRRGGGTALYISSLLTHSEINLRLPLTDSSINIVGAVVYLRKRRVAVLTVYRPPHTPLSELYSLELCLSSIFCSVIICMGDVNIDLLNPRGAHARLLDTVMSLFSLRQIIDTPTRITESSSSLLDIILLSNDMVVSGSGVCDAINISDHRVIYVFIGISSLVICFT